MLSTVVLFGGLGAASQTASAQSLQVYGGNLVIVADSFLTSPVDSTESPIIGVGSGHTFTFRTRNVANSGTLNVSNVTVTGPDAASFKMHGPINYLVGAGQTAFFNVSFYPMTMGDKTATVTVVSNDPSNPNYSFKIKGRALYNAPPLVNLEAGPGSKAVMKLNKRTGNYDLTLTLNTFNLSPIPSRGGNLIIYSDSDYFLDGDGAGFISNAPLFRRIRGGRLDENGFVINANRIIHARVKDISPDVAQKPYLHVYLNNGGDHEQQQMNNWAIIDIEVIN